MSPHCVQSEADQQAPIFQQSRARNTPAAGPYSSGQGHRQYQCGLGQGKAGRGPVPQSMVVAGQAGSKKRGWPVFACVHRKNLLGQELLHLLRAADLMMSTNSGFREAPPTCGAGIPDKSAGVACKKKEPRSC